MNDTYSIRFQTEGNHPWAWLDTDIYASDKYECLFEFGLIYNPRRYTKNYYNPY